MARLDQETREQITASEAAVKAHIQPTLASRLFLIWRVMEDVWRRLNKAQNNSTARTDLAQNACRCHGRYLHTRPI